MAIFTVETERDIIVENFMKATNERLKKNDIVKNPFIGIIKKVPFFNHPKAYYLIDMQPLYPPFYLGGFFVLIPAVIWESVRIPFLIGGAILLLLGIFWSKYFLYYMLQLGLKKVGYKGSNRMVNNKEVLEVVIRNVL